MGWHPNPPCTALGISFLEDIISKACSFCKLPQGINKIERKVNYFSTRRTHPHAGAPYNGLR